MPAILANYQVLLVFNNDTHGSVTVELQRTYGQNYDSVQLVGPADSVTLVLDAGSVYRYSIRKGWNVVEVTAQSWRDVNCSLSHLFTENSPRSNGVTIDRVWQDYRCFYAHSDSASKGAT